jgi:hypothetical protein
LGEVWDFRRPLGQMRMNIGKIYEDLICVAFKRVFIVVRLVRKSSE